MTILTVALQSNGKLLPASFELIEAAKSLGGEIHTVVLAESAQPLAEELAGRGGGKVMAVSHPELKHFNDEIYTNVLAEMAGKVNPQLILGPGTTYGKALMGRLAAKLGYAMASDVSRIAADGDQTVATRSHFGGSVVSEVVCSSDRPFCVTIRPKLYSESTDGAGEVETESVSDAALQSRMKVTELKSEASGKVSLAEADIIVSAGRGLKAAENLPLVQELANSLGAAFGASRAIVDAGWTAYSNQVGQTGKTVNPKLYVAIGISGAIQHLVGMRTSRTIVAINKDKDAPIFGVANYGIVGDALEIVPALTKKFSTELGN